MKGISKMNLNKIVVSILVFLTFIPGGRVWGNEEICDAENLVDCNGKRVELIGIFTTTKGCVGDVNGVLLPGLTDKCSDIDKIHI